MRDPAADNRAILQQPTHTATYDRRTATRPRPDAECACSVVAKRL